MAVGAFPLFKLGLLVVKQVSKPIANAIARRAKSSRIFREYICIPVAQAFHWYDVKVRMKILNLGKVTHIPKLNEDKAIETGSQLLSEFIILSIASALIIFEYNRSAEKEEMKQAQIEQEKKEIKLKLVELELLADKQAAQIRELTRFAHDLEDKQRTFRLNIFKNRSSKRDELTFNEGKEKDLPIDDCDPIPGGSSAAQEDSASSASQEKEPEAVQLISNYPRIQKGLILEAAEFYLNEYRES